MFSDERRKVILASLSVHGALSVTDLAKVVRVSGVTIRRDLRVLEERGEIVRRRGGASLSRASMEEPSYLDKSVVAPAEKLAIAREAADLIQDGEIAMLGAGTSTQLLARLLRQRRLTIATNSLLVACELADAHDVEVFLIGGILRGNIRAMIGGAAEKAMSQMRFHTLFLSGNGLTAQCGLTTPNPHVASIDRAAADAARRVIVLADHTKIGVDSMVVTVPANRIDVVITDSGDERHLDALRAQGVEVRTVQAAFPA